jgi:SWIM zinc finger
MVVSIVPQQLSAASPLPRPILAYDRRTGQPVALLPSCSTPDAYHVVTMDGRCDCRGFQFRGRCRHIALVAPTAAADPLPCTGCHLYHLTDAERLKAHPDARRDLAPGGAAWLAVQKAAGGWPR